MLVQALVGSQDAAQRLSSTLVVVAHTDDEILGAGSRLPLLREARFVYVSDGAPPEGTDAARHGLSVRGYRQARRHEREVALGLCGIAPDRVIDIGVPDQQTSFHLADIARRLADLVRQREVHAVLTQPYEGGHPDHDATAFAVHAAVALVRARGAAAPEIVEMAGYHAGPNGPVAAIVARSAIFTFCPTASRYAPRTTTISPALSSPVTAVSSPSLAPDFTSTRSAVLSALMRIT